jgi:hypothetical protein
VARTSTSADFGAITFPECPEGDFSGSGQLHLSGRALGQQGTEPWLRECVQFRNVDDRLGPRADAARHVLLPGLGVASKQDAGGARGTQETHGRGLDLINDHVGFQVVALLELTGSLLAAALRPHDGGRDRPAFRLASWSPSRHKELVSRVLAQA